MQEGCKEGGRGGRGGWTPERSVGKNDEVICIRFSLAGSDESWLQPREASLGERVAGASPTLAAHQFSGSQQNFDQYWRVLVPFGKGEENKSDTMSLI